MSNHLIRKISSIFIFIIIFVAGFKVSELFGFDDDAVGRILNVSMIGLFCILFSQGFGSYIGPMWTIGRIGTRIDRQSPRGLLEVLGWILLFIPVVIFLIYYVTK